MIFGDLLAPGRLLVGQDEQQIDVGAGRQRAAAIAADGDERDALRRPRDCRPDRRGGWQEMMRADDLVLGGAEGSARSGCPCQWPSVRPRPRAGLVAGSGADGPAPARAARRRIACRRSPMAASSSASIGSRRTLQRDAAVFRRLCVSVRASGIADFLQLVEQLRSLARASFRRRRASRHRAPMDRAFSPGCGRPMAQKAADRLACGRLEERRQRARCSSTVSTWRARASTGSGRPASRATWMP